MALLDLLLPCFHGLPEFVIDDAQLRHLGGHPGAWRIEPRYALAGARGLHIAQPVPDESPDVELIVEEARPTVGMTSDGGFAPHLPPGAGDSLGVELAHDLARRSIGCEGAKDALNDGSLRRIDTAVAGDRSTVRPHGADDVVAIAKSATRLAGDHPYTQSAPGLFGEVLEEQGVYRALEAHVQLGDLTLG